MLMKNVDIDNSPWSGIKCNVRMTRWVTKNQLLKLSLVLNKELIRKWEVNSSKVQDLF